MVAVEDDLQLAPGAGRECMVEVQAPFVVGGSLVYQAKVAMTWWGRESGEIRSERYQEDLTPDHCARCRPFPKNMEESESSSRLDSCHRWPSTLRKSSPLEEEWEQAFSLLKMSSKRDERHRRQSDRRQSLQSSLGSVPSELLKRILAGDEQEHHPSSTSWRTWSDEVGARAVKFIDPLHLRLGRGLSSRKVSMTGQHVSAMILIALLLSVPMAAGQNSTFKTQCSTGDICCRIPPCRCGSYVACGNTECTIASCESCPVGGYCDCDVACSSTPGLEKVKACPKGYFCPGGSGWPTPCPESTFSDATNQENVDACKPCSLAFGSGKGSSACQITTISLIVIICGSFGFVCVASMLAYGIRWYVMKRRREVSQFEEEYHRSQLLKRQQMASGGIPIEMDEIPDASAPPFDYDDELENGSTATSSTKVRGSAADKKRAIERRMRELEDENGRIVDHIETAQRKAAAAAAAVEKSKKPQRKPRAGGSIFGAGGGKKKRPEEDEEENIEVCV